MFFAIGFETTAPSTALTLMRAKAEGIRNFSVFCNHVTIIPAIRAILDSPDMRIDAFIGPGHVSTVIGCRPYEWIAQNEGKPIVVSGFEPLDVLQSIVMLLRQLGSRRSEGGESIQARGAVGRQSRRASKRWPKSSNCAPTSNGAAWASSRNRPCASDDSLRGVGCRAALPCSRHSRHRSESGAVRRSSEGRPEARAVQAVRQGVHAGASRWAR